MCFIFNVSRCDMSEDDPITGIGVIESISNVPQGYVAITTSADGKDADIWKDGFFARAVRRYICYTRVFPLDNGRWRNVVKDIKIVKVNKIRFEQKKRSLFLVDKFQRNSEM